MRTRWLLFVSLVCGCSYTVTDDARVNDIVNRQNYLEQRLDTIESRVNTQGEEVLKLRRGLMLK